MTLPSERASERVGHIRWARLPVAEAAARNVPAWYHALPLVGRGNPRTAFVCGADGSDLATARTAQVNAGDACPACMRIVAALALEPRP